MSTANHDYEEKRNFIRMFVDAKVTITDPLTGNTCEGESKNLSGDGVLFITSQKFQENQTLEVDIRSEQSKLAPLKAQFSVKRIKELSDDKFEVAGTINDVK